MTSYPRWFDRLTDWPFGPDWPLVNGIMSGVVLSIFLFLLLLWVSL